MRFLNRGFLLLLSTCFPWLLACWFFAIPTIVSGAAPSREDSLRKALANTTDDNKKVQVYLSLASLLKNRAADSSLLFLDRALKICWEKGSLEDIGRIFFVRGQISRNQNMPGEAIRQLKIAEFIFRKLGDKLRLTHALNLIGTVYSNNYSIGISVSESCRYYLKALSVAREINDTSSVVALYNNLGTLFSDAKDYPAAIDYYKKAQVLWDRWNDSVRRATVYLNLGSIYINSGKFDTSRSYFEKAIPILRAKNNQPLLLASLAGQAYSLLKEKRYAEAMTSVNQASDYITTSGFQENSTLAKIALCDIYNIMGQVNYETGSYGLAREYLLRGYHVLDSLDDYSRIRGIAEPLAMIYQKAGRADSALLIYQRILIKSDTFTNNQITSFSKLFAAQMEYEQEVREQQLQLQYRKTIQKRNLMIFIGSGVLLISFILILILRLRLEQQKKKRVEAEKKQAVLEKQTADLKVEAQEKELALKVMNLLKKEEFNVELTNRLIELQKKAGEENIKSEIVGLINTLQRESGERMWDEFEVRFRQVHSGFYERLLINYPDLTANELKICALLRLNLSTKEICELTGQRTVSLDVARSRLRKKLGLTSSQTNLVTFLTQI